MTGRILIVSPGDSRSGAGQFRHALALGLQARGHAIVLAQPAEDGPDQAADHPDQGGLARPVRPEKRENLALLNVEVDVLERLESAGVGLGQMRNRNDRLHAAPWRQHIQAWR